MLLATVPKCLEEMREEGSSCGSWFRGFQSTLAEKACWQEDLNGLKHEEAASVGQPGGRNHARDKIPRGPTSQCSTSTRWYYILWFCNLLSVITGQGPSV